MKINWFNKGNVNITGNTMIGITEQGKREVMKFSSDGSGFNLLAPLEDRSPQTVSRLMQETGMGFPEIKHRLEILEKQRYIKFAGSEGDER